MLVIRIVVITLASDSAKGGSPTGRSKTEVFSDVHSWKTVEGKPASENFSQVFSAALEPF